jgi:hypothetical protein
VAQWVRIVFRNLTIRLSEVAGHNPDSTSAFAFPTQAMIDEWRGVLHTLVGFENDKDYGGGLAFNFVLSNGERS